MRAALAQAAASVSPPSPARRGAPPRPRTAAPAARHPCANCRRVASMGPLPAPACRRKGPSCDQPIADSTSTAGQGSEPAGLRWALARQPLSFGATARRFARSRLQRGLRGLLHVGISHAAAAVHAKVPHVAQHELGNAAGPFGADAKELGLLNVFQHESRPLVGARHA